MKKTLLLTCVLPTLMLSTFSAARAAVSLDGQEAALVHEDAYDSKKKPAPTPTPKPRKPGPRDEGDGD